jgi:hypothetical protein
MAINSFQRNDGEKLIFFGLRGCLPVGGSNANSSFAVSHTLKLVEINYQNPRCTIGQSDTEGHTLAVFPGSTVPTLSYVQSAERNDGDGANQLMTGYYRFEKGVHHNGKPTGHRAFRQKGTRVCRRTADNSVYQPTDRVADVEDDNLHAAFGKTLDGTYSSAGCQVVLGIPKCEKFSADEGPWPAFRDRAYQIDQKDFSYILLDGVQVAEISKDPDTLTPLLLRCGSVESALPAGHADLIKTLQTALKQAGLYNEEPDEKFGARTAEAIAEFQKRNVGATYVDAVVGPPTGMALLKNNGSWPNV